MSLFLLPSIAGWTRLDEDSHLGLHSLLMQCSAALVFSNTQDLSVKEPQGDKGFPAISLDGQEAILGDVFRDLGEREKTHFRLLRRGPMKQRRE